MYHYQNTVFFLQGKVMHSIVFQHFRGKVIHGGLEFSQEVKLKGVWCVVVDCGEDQCAL